MLTGDRITPRPAEKRASSRIEKFGAEIAKLSQESCRLTDLCDELARLAGREDEIGREALLLMLLCGWRHGNAGDEESDAVGLLLDTITTFLEEQSGVTAEDLGFGGYVRRRPEALDDVFALIERAKAEPATEATL
jgi:hypothetical protein